MNAPNATQCPPESMLSDFGLGKLDAAKAETVSQHIETCADCRQRVANLPGDSFVNRLRGVPDGAAQPIEHTFVGGDSASNAAHTSETPWGKRPESRRAAIPRPSRTVDGKPHDGLVPARRDSAPPELANHPDYELVKELGRGGMGVVYLAKNRMMDRLEVLKVVSKTLLDKPGALERFQQEIRSAAKLLHPNIVAAHAVLRLGDLLVFAMEYVPGQDLMQVVKKRGYLPIANATFYAHQVALGLQHAHEKGMVHRDIKPNNLMLAIEGKKHVVKILDFGLAKATSEKAAETALTKSGQMLGTPDYIAPEQTLDAHQADIRADIYSLGCTLYYFLAGRPPFQEASLYALLEAHQRRDAQPLNLVRPDVPVELAAVVAKMLAKDPAKRYQTPIEVARALTPFFKPGQTTATSAASQQTENLVPQASTETAAGAVSPTETWSPAQPAPMPIPTAQPAVPVVPIPLRAAATEAGISIDTHRPTARRAGWWKSRPPWQRYASTAGASAVLLLAIALTIRTPRGTVEIALSDPKADVTFAVDGDVINITGLDKPLSLLVGEHDLKVTSNDYETFTKKFTVTKGKNAPLTVTLVPRETDVDEPAPALDKPAKDAGPLGSAPLEHNNEASCCRFSPDGKLLASGGKDGIANIWDAFTGEKLHELVIRETVQDVTFSPDSKMLLTWTGGSPRGNSAKWKPKFWDAATAKEIMNFPIARPMVGPLAFSADGAMIAVAADEGTVELYDKTGKPLVSLAGQRGGITCLAFSPDGKLLASGSEERVMKLWRITDKSEVLSLEDDQKSSFMPMVHTVLFSRDGRLLIVGINANTLVYDLNASKTLWKNRTNTWRAFSLAISPDNKFVVAAGGQGDGDHFVVVDPLTGDTIRKVRAWRGYQQGNRGAEAIALSPDGRVLASAGPDHTIKIWDTATWEERQAAVNDGEKSNTAPATSGQPTVKQEQASRPQSASAAPVEPTADAQAFNGHWYKFFPEVLTWQAARDRCKSYGGHLLVIDSLDENRFVAGLVVRGGRDDTWLGVTDEDDEGKWRTVDGAALNFTNWKEGEPNNALRGEDYAVMQEQAKWQWDDKPNDQLFGGFVCEWEFDPSSAKTDDTRASFVPPNDAPPLFEGAGPIRSVPTLMANVKPQFWSGGAALSLDGTRLLANDDGITRLWDAATGMMIRDVGPKCSRSSIAFLRDGARAVTSDRMGNIDLWDTVTGQRIGKFEFASECNVVQRVSVSDDSRLLVACIAGTANKSSDGLYTGGSFPGKDPSVRVWEIESQRELRQMAATGAMVTCAAFLPHSHEVVWGSQWDRDRVAVGIWDADEGIPIGDIDRGIPEVLDLSISPDGHFVAAALANWSIRIWDLRTRKRIQEIVGLPKKPGGITFSPDGSLVLSVAGGDGARLWAVKSGQEIANTNNKDSYLPALFFPNGRGAVLVAASGIFKWDCPSMAPKHPASAEVGNANRIAPVAKPVPSAPTSFLKYKHRGWNTGGVVALSPDGTKLLAAEEGVVRLRDAETGTVLRDIAPEGNYNYLTFLRDGSRAAIGDLFGQIGIWETPTAKLVGEYRASNEVVHCISTSDDGRLVLACYVGHCDEQPDGGPPPGIGFVPGINTAVVTWDMQKQTEMPRLDSHGGIIRSAAFLPRSHNVVWGSDKGDLAVWDADAGKQFDTIESDLPPVHHLSVSSDGRLVAAALGNWTVCIWDRQTRRRVRSIGGMPREPIFAFLSPDGSRVLSLAEDDGARLWEVATGAEVANTKNKDRYYHAAFFPDGRNAILAPPHGDIFKWKLPPQPKSETTKTVPTAKDHEREVAEWVLSMRGKVRVNGMPLDPANHQGLDKLSGPLELTEVNLGKSFQDPKPLTDADMERFRDLSHLRDLNLLGQGISDKGLAKLQGLPALSSLQLEKTNVTDASANTITQFPQLGQLILRDTSIGDAGVEQIVKRLPELTSLDFHSTSIGDEGLAHIISGTPKLTTLHLDETLVTSSGMQDLCQLRYLQHLVLNATADDAVLARLAELPRLDRLEMFGDRITNEGIRHIKEFKSLTWLEIRSHLVDDQSLRNLQSASLKKLYIHHEPMVSGKVLKHLKTNLPALESLWLINSRLPIQDDDLAAFAEMTGLREIVFTSASASRITDAGLAHLKQLKNLVHLELAGAKKVSEQGIESLRAALPKCKIDWP